MLEHRDTKNLVAITFLISAIFGWPLASCLVVGFGWSAMVKDGLCPHSTKNHNPPNVSTNTSISSLIRKLSPLRRPQGSGFPLRRKEYPAHSSTCETIFLPGVPRSSKHICALGKSPPCPALVVTVSATTAPCVAEHYRRFLSAKLLHVHSCLDRSCLVGTNFPCKCPTQ